MSAWLPVTVSSSGNADDPQRHRHAGLHQHGGTRFAQSAVDRMFFDGDDRAAFAAGVESPLACRAA